MLNENFMDFVKLNLASAILALQLSAALPTKIINKIINLNVMFSIILLSRGSELSHQTSRPLN